MDLITVVILGLAGYRLTRLVVVDSLFDNARLWFFDRPQRILHPVKLILNCTWCAGIWITASLYAFWLSTYPWEWTRADWIVLLAATGIQGMMHALEPE